MRELTKQDLELVSGGHTTCGGDIDQCDQLQASESKAREKAQWFQKQGKQDQAKNFREKAKDLHQMYVGCRQHDHC